MRALVAGGAGGLGRAICRRMVEAGYELTIADLDAERAAAVAAEVGAARFVGADLADESAVRQAIEIAANGGHLNALVNSQGISPKKQGKKRPFYEIDLEEWNRVLATNLTGPFLLMRTAVDHLARDGTASIVNIGSIMAKLGASGPDGAVFGPVSPSGAHYTASKAALHNLTVSVARELAPLGVRCNGVSPGYIGTGMGGTTSAGLDAIMRPQIPLGRAADADEVAAAVMFLLSDEARYITGEIIDVDGGWHPD